MSKRHIFGGHGTGWFGGRGTGGHGTGWRWIMYAPLLSVGFWLMVEPALASERHQSSAGHRQADTLCTATVTPIAGLPTGSSPTAGASTAHASTTGTASSNIPAPLEHRFRRGHGTRIDCRRRDGQWQAVEQRFELDDIHLLARSNGDRTLRAWEDDRDNRIVRRRTLDLPAPGQWQSGTQAGSQASNQTGTLSHRLEQRQTNRADCPSTATGRCSARQTTDTWVQTTATGVRLVQQRYINGTFAERVSWYLNY